MHESMNCSYVIKLFDLSDHVTMLGGTCVLAMNTLK